jgi:hypothetical protein
MAIILPTAAQAALQTPLNTFSPTSNPLANTVNSLTYNYNSALGIWTSAATGSGLAAASLAEAAAGVLTSVYSSPQTSVPKNASGMTGSALIPAGNTAARPAAGAYAGQFRYNTQIPQLEYSDGASWLPVTTGAVTSFSAGTTGLLPSAATSGAVTLSGTLGIANGGTGATTGAGALAGLGMSVDASGGTTGLTFSGGPVTSSGTLTMAGTLAVANGGTGATAAAAAINNLLPGQGGNSGKFLTTDGTNVSWATAGGSVTPPGVGSVYFLARVGVPGGTLPGSQLLTSAVSLGALQTPSGFAIAGYSGPIGVGTWTSTSSNADYTSTGGAAIGTWIRIA